MGYFLTVKTKTGQKLHADERHERLESALRLVSARYLCDCRNPWRFSGHFALRGGQLYRLTILPKENMAGAYLRQDIALIEIVSDQHFLEAQTFLASPD